MKRSLIAILLIALLLIGGCTPAQPVEEASPEVETPVVENTTPEAEQEAETSVYPLEITDSYDRVVVLEEEPKKVVSIAPSITETIFALDKGSLLVGRTDWCDYPTEALDVQSIGSLSDPSIETITEIDPDLIIASTHFSQDTLANLEKLGFKVLVLYGPESIEGAYETIEKVALALNASEKAESLITEMKATVESVVTAVEGLEKPSVYYVVAYGTSDYTATGETFISQMIEMAGGYNIASDTTGWAYNLETLVEKDPEVIVCSMYYETKAGFETADVYKDLSAVKNNQLLEIDNNKLDRQGPRVADGLMDLAKLIHPEAFN